MLDGIDYKDFGIPAILLQLLQKMYEAKIMIICEIKEIMSCFIFKILNCWRSRVLLRCLAAISADMFKFI